MTLVNAHSHDTGQGWLGRLSPERVANAPDPITAFDRYAQQVTGVPWGTSKDIATLRRKIKVVFERYPQANYYSLCRVLHWANGKDIRRPRSYMYVDLFRDCWAAKGLPELNEPAPNPHIEQRMYEALRVEQDPSWRRRLIGAVGFASRNRVLNDWTAARG